MAYVRRKTRARRASSRPSYAPRRRAPVRRTPRRVGGRVSSRARSGAQTVKVVIEHRSVGDVQRPAFLDGFMGAVTEPKKAKF